MIRFIKLRLPAFIFSLIIILISIWYSLGPSNLNMAFFAPRGLNLGIDFQGGLVHQVTIYSGIDQEQIREYAVKSGLGSVIQEVVIPEKKKIGMATSYLIKTIIAKEDQQIINNDPDLTSAKFLGDKTKKFYAMIEKKYGKTYALKGKDLDKANKIYPNKITGENINSRSNDIRILQNVVKQSENVISPVYSKGLRMQALILILFVLLAMLLYISFRFKFKYAVGSVLALVHDVVIIIGFISITHLEFDYTIIAAILFIIGYSLNDTIVIFDRIRENYGIMKDFSSKEIINTSINQSLSRTIITSLTTLLAVIALYIWGGPKVYGFSLTLIVGIFCGTYSSIFIASPVVDSWESMFANKKTRLKELKKKERSIINDQEQTKEIGGTNIIANKPAKISLSKKQLKKISGMKKK